jgi:SAM-dependent methyltransferase
VIGPPDLAALESLVASDEIGDRAFAAGALLLARRSEHRDAIERLTQRLRDTARRHHAGLQDRIRSSTVDRLALATRLLCAPAEVRDHLAEEILDIAYPPVEESEDGTPDADTLDAPSGVPEILFAVERSGLAPGKTFVDLGSGAGKVVLLVAILTGATAIGMESDPRRLAEALRAAAWLGLDGVRFVGADIRRDPLPAADVYYMHIPFAGSAEVVGRLEAMAAARKVRLFSQALDLEKFPWLARPGGERTGSYWLEMYEGR